MTQAEPSRRESIIGLARQLVGGLVQLARLELTRGRQEIGQMLAETKAGAMLLGAAAAVSLLAVISLDVAIVLGVAALFEAITPTAAAIVVVAAFAAVAVLYAAVGVVNLVVAFAMLVGAAAFGVPAWLGFAAGWTSALLVLVLEAAIAALLVVRGIRQVRVGPPEETIEAVKEDIAWAKRLMRRG